jgi:hypothetical protein
MKMTPILRKRALRQANNSHFDGYKSAYAQTLMLRSGRLFRRAYRISGGRQ